MRKHHLLILAFIAFIAGLFFMLRTSSSSQPQSMLKGHKTEYKNKTYLDKKLSDSKFLEKNNVSNVTIVLSSSQQPTTVAERRNDAGVVEVSLAYDLQKNGNNAVLTLYVNPSMYPDTNPAELERQYTQLALIAIYDSAHVGEPKSVKDLQTFLGDYRSNIAKNTIFTVK